MESIIYNAQGKKTGTLTLPESVFGVFWNDALMHQVVTSMHSNARPPVAHTKGRGEVRGGGRKPWQQKGTGRARHGSIRSPIWKGGGVTHGPSKDKNYEKAIPKKMRAKALYMALSRKMKDGEIIFVDSFGISEPKTAVAKKVSCRFPSFPDSLRSRPRAGTPRSSRSPIRRRLRRRASAISQCLVRAGAPAQSDLRPR